MRTSTASPPDGEVTIATFPNPYEAELAHAALESEGIPAIVRHDHGQYFSAGAWVHLQVARSASEHATRLLEQGPLSGTARADEAAASDATQLPDDMEPLRASRRILLARWFLFGGALMCLFSVLLLPLSVIAL